MVEMTLTDHEVGMIGSAVRAIECSWEIRAGSAIHDALKELLRRTKPIEVGDKVEIKTLGFLGRKYKVVGFFDGKWRLSEEHGRCVIVQFADDRPFIINEKDVEAVQ